MWLCFKRKKKVNWHDKIEESVEIISENVEETIDNIIDDVTEKLEDKVEVILNNVEEEVKENMDDILDKIEEKIDEKVEDLVDDIVENFDNNLQNNEETNDTITDKPVLGMSNTIKQIAVKRQDSMSDLTIESDLHCEDVLNNEVKPKVRPDTPIFDYSPIPKNSLRGKKV